MAHFDMERFACTHCGHRFEAPPAETLICPNCFWSTSVQKEETSGPSAAGGPEAKTGEGSTGPLLSPRLLTLIGGGIGFVLLLVGASFFALHYLGRQNEMIQAIQKKTAQAVAAQAPELRLSPEENEILNRKTPLEPARPLSPSEQQILNRRFPFRRSLLEGLPTPPWNEKEFEAFLKAQEIQYRLPLEWSYRRKLKRIVKEHYVSAAQSFEEKNFLKARDEWIRALVFPIYRNDIKKHQGVILTLLRPYINDTLSKIGAMNALLTEKDLYAAEDKIRAAYEELQDLLEREGWEEANAKILELTQEIERVAHLESVASPPPLPEEAGSIDPDIRQVLLAQIEPLKPGVPDWDSLRADLRAKENVVQARIPSSLAATQRQYEEALLLIQQQRWQDAKRVLEKIDFPEEWHEDARAKIRILDGLIQGEATGSERASLDSQENSG